MSTTQARDRVFCIQTRFLRTLGMVQPNFTVRWGRGERHPGAPAESSFFWLWQSRRSARARKKELFLEGRSPSKPPSTLQQQPQVLNHALHTSSIDKLL